MTHPAPIILPAGVKLEQFGRPIYIASRWDRTECAGDPESTEVGIISTDLAKVEAFVARNPVKKVDWRHGDWSISEVEDGEEWPSL